MSTIPLYNTKTKKPGTLKLPHGFADYFNQVLLDQAIHVYRDRSHNKPAKVKGRSDVILSKRKAWRQKGTGRARHGARSAPLFVGGGKAHRPTGVKKVLTLPKKIKSKALQSAMTMKLKNKKIVAIEGVQTIKKTKKAAELLAKIAEGNKFTIVLSVKSNAAKRYFRNIKNVRAIYFYESLSAYEIYLGGTIVLDANIFKKS